MFKQRLLDPLQICGTSRKRLLRAGTTTSGITIIFRTYLIAINNKRDNLKKTPCASSYEIFPSLAERSITAQRVSACTLMNSSKEDDYMPDFADSCTRAHFLTLVARSAYCFIV